MRDQPGGTTMTIARGSEAEALNAGGGEGLPLEAFLATHYARLVRRATLMCRTHWTAYTRALRQAVQRGRHRRGVRRPAWLCSSITLTSNTDGRVMEQGQREVVVRVMDAVLGG